MSVIPFLRWPGGKRWASSQIGEIIMSSRYDRYIEPFLGGGAIFFSLTHNKSTLSDINPDLINVYKVIQQYPLQLIDFLKKIPTDQKTYYEIRQTEFTDKIEQAGRFLYLNRLAFGGMYRVNKSGKFNVPYGGGRKVDLLWEKNLITNANMALKTAKIYCEDFEKIISKSKDGDVVYCDPAYTVSHNNNSFLRYNENIFSWHDQKRLAQACFDAAERGAKVIVSNAANSSLDALYQPIKPLIIKRYSGISRRAKGRGLVNEYLFVLN